MNVGMDIFSKMFTFANYMFIISIQTYVFALANRQSDRSNQVVRESVFKSPFLEWVLITGV